MLEQLGKRGIELPAGTPKDWRAYNEINDPDERSRVKSVIRELHAQHCPPGSFQVASEVSGTSSRGRRGYKARPTAQRSLGYGDW